MPADSYWEWTQLLRKWGLPLPKEVWRVENVDEAIERIHEFEKRPPEAAVHDRRHGDEGRFVRPARASWARRAKPRGG